jgi:hypothetical protein
MAYEFPHVESTVEVEALLTWGADKKKKKRRGGGGSNHS